ncbi:MAG: RNA methyltransferase [Treponema sp.]|nr:RNA methyltransferase [Treponema sp.]
MQMSDIVVVLCRPSEPGNVGAVCRAMKNMGLSALRLVAPGAMDRAELLARAIHADDVWRGARTFDTLAGAVADCSFAVGTTCRRGRKRKASMRPRDLAARLAERAAPGVRAALVFGNERAGLDASELNQCNLASHIPVSDEFPSLNLSHAVQVYAYELFLAFGGAGDLPVKGEWVPLTRAAADGLTGEITDTLKDLGFYKQPGREEQERFLRDLICRAGLTEREGRYLKGIFDKAARLGSMKFAPDAPI